LLAFFVIFVPSCGQFTSDHAPSQEREKIRGAGHLANSSLVGQIAFKSNSVTRMTTNKQYDSLAWLMGQRRKTEPPPLIDQAILKI
jgi:hypothetical protein